MRSGRAAGGTATAEPAVAPPRRAERGTATAELAVALPSLVLVLVLALAAVDLGLEQVRCVDAARLGARLLARGEPEAAVLAQVRAAAPTGARVVVQVGATRVSVLVTGGVPPALRPLGVVTPPNASAQSALEAAP